MMRYTKPTPKRPNPDEDGVEYLLQQIEKAAEDGKRCIERAERCIRDGEFPTDAIYEADGCFDDMTADAQNIRDRLANIKEML